MENISKALSKELEGRTIARHIMITAFGHERSKLSSPLRQYMLAIKKRYSCTGTDHNASSENVTMIKELFHHAKDRWPSDWYLKMKLIILSLVKA